MCVSVHGLHRAWVKQCLWLYHLYDISTFNKCPSLTLLAYDVFAVWHYMFIEMERKINVVASLRCWYLVGRYICNIRNQAVYFIIILVLFRSMCVCSRYINEEKRKKERKKKPHNHLAIFELLSQTFRNVRSKKRQREKERKMQKWKRRKLESAYFFSGGIFFKKKKKRRIWWLVESSIMDGKQEQAKINLK